MEKNMKENFKKLERRVCDSFRDTDLDKINYELSKISGPTLVSGVGGSSVVSEYASKILSSKNHIITRNTEPRDFKYIDTSLYDNVLSCSYSGNNYGVSLSFDNSLRHYLLASKENNNGDIVNLTYNCSDKEKSFISLAATLIPCSILLNYYIDNEWYRIIDDVDMLVDVKGSYSVADNNYLAGVTFVASDPVQPQYSIYGVVNSSTHKVTTYFASALVQALTSVKGYVTVQYTKTTD